MNAFSISALPHLEFGPQRIRALPDLLVGRSLASVVVIFSRSVFADAELRDGFARMLHDVSIHARYLRYDRSPDDADVFEAPRGSFAEASADVVDALVRRLATDRPDGIVAVGGGSAIDTAKALAVGLAEFRSDPGWTIVDYLEGVGTVAPSGDRLPLIACPTTAGTGSEATRNAVLSRPGEGGFKKSLRHRRFVPDVALVDPVLQLGTPRAATAASGLDAITQLLEAYIARTATPFTDALALDGLVATGRSFARAVDRGGSDLDARSGMAYAAYLSGVCLANAGLGTVHGLAGPAGAMTVVPHGVFCGTLLPRVVVATIDGLLHRRDALGTLGKYAAAGRALCGRSTGSLEGDLAMLSDRLNEFVSLAAMPSLSTFGIDETVARRIAEAGDDKANPHSFNADERTRLILGEP